MNWIYKRILLFLAVFSIIMTITCVSAVENTNTTLGDSVTSDAYVSPNGNDVSGDGSQKNPYNSLNHALSENASTVHLEKGTYKGENNRNITLNKSLTVIGKSKETTIIDCESQSRLFTMTSTSNLTLIGLTLKNGYSADSGGLIYNTGGHITIIDCIISDCVSNKNGSVICNNPGTLIMENTLITNNAANDLGAIHAIGTTTIRNSNFTHNRLTSKWGVGACIATLGTLNLDGCIFSDCFTTYSAAGISTYGNTYINNCRFERLYTNYTAGAISNHGHMVINNSYFGYNDVQYYAAAILAPPCGYLVTTEVYNSIFEENHAGFHGAVSNNYKNTTLYMENCAIVGNYLQKNRAYGDVALDDNATLIYCWWGQNTISPYYYSPHDGNRNPEKINASRWLVMTFTSTGSVDKNRNSIVTVDLNYYFDNETKEIHRLNGTVNLPLEVTVYTDSQSITKRLVNGVATFTIKPGDNDDFVYAKLDNQVLQLDVNTRYSAWVAKDFTKYYKSSQKLSVKLVDCYGKGIKGQKVTVKIDGVTYTGTTNSNGVVTVKVKNTPKTFRVEVSYAGNDYYTGSSASLKVKVVKPIIKISKTKVKRNKNLVITFKNANKKAIKNVKVKIKIKGKTYVKKTNKNGQVKIKIKLKANRKYTVKASFKSTKTYGTTTLIKKIKVTK